jgi:hypothetical protein
MIFQNCDKQETWKPWICTPGQVWGMTPLSNHAPDEQWWLPTPQELAPIMSTGAWCSQHSANPDQTRSATRSSRLIFREMKKQMSGFKCCSTAWRMIHCRWQGVKAWERNRMSPVRNGGSLLYRADCAGSLIILHTFYPVSLNMYSSPVPTVETHKGKDGPESLWVINMFNLTNHVDHMSVYGDHISMYDDHMSMYVDHMSMMIMSMYDHHTCMYDHYEYVCWSYEYVWSYMYVWSSWACMLIIWVYILIIHVCMMIMNMYVDHMSMYDGHEYIWWSYMYVWWSYENVWYTLLGTMEKWQKRNSYSLYGLP